MASERLCVNCKHYSGSGYCKHPSLASLINGRVQPQHCNSMRFFSTGAFGTCGQSGRFWEQAPPKPPKRSLWQRIFAPTPDPRA